MKNYKCFITILLLILIPTFSIADENYEEKSIDLNQILEVSTNISETPNINARHAIVLDRASKTVLYGKKENEICKMASTTKIMTAIIVLENCTNLNEQVTISKKSARNRRFKARIIHQWYNNCWKFTLWFNDGFWEWCCCCSCRIYKW